MSIQHSATRITALDQFRGYTVVGMLLVNFLGSYQICPDLLRHSNDHLSYADTIMPQFLFAVGFAMRLSLTRKLRSQGGRAVALRMARRLCGLILIALVIYTVSPPAKSWQELVELGFWGAIQGPLKSSWFQTLMHIAVTSLWILPVIWAGSLTRLLWLIASIGLHLWLSAWFNFEWVHASPRAIDGGPLGFLTWSIPALVGSFTYDLMASSSTTAAPAKTRLRLWKPLMLAVLLMSVGYLLSCGSRFYDVVNTTPPNTTKLDTTNLANTLADSIPPKLAASPVFPTAEQIDGKLASTLDKKSFLLRTQSFLTEPPFVSPPPPELRQWNYWMMSQRAGTTSYLSFAAGFSLLIFILFYVACEKHELQWSVFRLYGTNALLAYVIHDLIASAVKPFAPRDAPLWYVLICLLIFFAITSLFVRHFEKNQIFIRV